MRALFTHGRIRLGAVLRSPLVLIVLLFSGGVSIFFWPCLASKSGVEGVFFDTGAELDVVGGGPAAIVILWAFTWSLMAGLLVGGAAVGGRKTDTVCLRALPALPIGARARALAEAFVVLTFVVVLRGAHCLWFGFHLDPPEYFAASCAGYMRDTLLGSLLVLPFLVAWVTPGRSVHFWFIKPVVLAALLWGAFELELLAEPVPFAATCLVLTGLSLLAVSREPSIPLAWRKRAGPPESRVRTARPPEEQLCRDQWLRPLPAVGMLLAAEAVLVIAERAVGFPDYGFYFGSCLVFGFLFSYVALRPLGCNLFSPYPLVRRQSESTGFAAAWTVLPVRRAAVIRGAYAHGLVTGAGILAAIIGVAVLTTWLQTGRAALVDFGGDPAGEVFYPLLALVPCLAGGLASAAAGDRLLGFVSLAAGICVLMGHFLMLILGPPVWIHAGVLIVLAFGGGVPPLWHLRTRALLQNS